MLIFFWLSQTWPVTLRIQEWVFSGCNVPPDTKETKLGSRNKEDSLWAGKNNEIVLVPRSHMKVCPYSYFRRYGYFRGPWISFIMTDEFSLRVTKITSRIGVSWTHSLPSYFNQFLTRWIMTILGWNYDLSY